MDISGSYTLYAPRERVWAALLDADMLRRTVPGCELLEQIDDGRYRVRLNVGVAAVKGIYEGTLRLTDLQPPERYRMIMEGKGARGILRGDGTLSLDTRDSGATVVSYAGQAQLGGAIAGVGMRVAGGAASMLIKSYFSRLADALAEAGDPPPAPISDNPVSTATASVAEDLPASPATASPGTSLPDTPARTAPAAPMPSHVPTEAPQRPGGASVSGGIAPNQRGPIVRLVRRAGLSDGSIESEQRWARGVLSTALIIAAVAVVAIAIILGQTTGR